ncbi:DUF3761 domain-containing protein [Williamsia sp. M5A3_1d]
MSSARLTIDRGAMSENRPMRTMMLRRALASTAVTGALTLAMFTGATATGSSVAQADPGPVHTVSDGCGSGYYENSRGSCIPEPNSTPSGIRCKDGTYSHATTRQGACSRHGGIDSGSGSGPTDGDAAAIILGSFAIGGLALGSAALGPLVLFGSS